MTKDKNCPKLPKISKLNVSRKKFKISFHYFPNFYFISVNIFRIVRKVIMKSRKLSAATAISAQKNHQALNCSTSQGKHFYVRQQQDV